MARGARTGHCTMVEMCLMASVGLSSICQSVLYQFSAWEGAPMVMFWDVVIIVNLVDLYFVDLVHGKVRLWSCPGM